MKEMMLCKPWRHKAILKRYFETAMSLQAPFTSTLVFLKHVVKRDIIIHAVNLHNTGADAAQTPTTIVPSLRLA
jgi:hypothetical protein